jgi:putative zinc finger/helix-turn-helix YgiT family protein
MIKQAQSARFGVPVERQPCIVCGDGTATRSLVEHEFQHGSGDDAVCLRVELPVWTCDACELEYTDEDAEVIRHAAVCRHLGRLTPSEIKVIRCAGAMTQQQFAAKLNVGVASVKRWELGTVIQNAAYDQLVRQADAEIRAQRLQQPVFQTPITAAAIEASSRFKLRVQPHDRLAA